MTSNALDLTHKVALVTGARRGIGRAVAVAFADAGADVAVSDLVSETGELEGTAAEIVALGRASLAIPADISREDQVQAMAARALECFGRIDILVNCAGIWVPGNTLVDTDLAEWNRVIGTNLTGTYLCCKSVGKIMMAQNTGNIIILSSQVGLNPGVAIGAYSVSKAGLIMLTRQLALELSPFNIRVNAIAPGVVMTDFNRNVWDDPSKATQVSGMIPLGRMATPDDVANPALFLASDASSYMTGAVLPVDGGWKVPASPP